MLCIHLEDYPYISHSSFSSILDVLKEADRYCDDSRSAKSASNNRAPGTLVGAGTA